MSIQEAAVFVLNSYYRDFPVFNSHLERIVTNSNGMRLRGLMNKSKQSGISGSLVKGNQVEDLLAQFKVRLTESLLLSDRNALIFFHFRFTRSTGPLTMSLLRATLIRRR